MGNKLEMKRNMFLIVGLITSLEDIHIHSINIFMVTNELYYNKMEQSYHLDAIREIRTVENQLQRAVIDIHGNRVRSEEYAQLSQPNVIEVLALTKRKDRVDSVRGTFTFNNNIDVSKLKDSSSLWIIIGAGLLNYDVILRNAYIIKYPPDLCLTSVEITYSNGIDELKEISTGGHIGTVHGYATGVLFNYYARYINGKEKLTGYRINDEGIANVNWSSGVKISWYEAWGNEPTHERARIDYPDGSFEQWDLYMLNRYGENISRYDFYNLQRLGRANPFDLSYEYIINASEFKGRTIDIVGLFSAGVTAARKMDSEYGKIGGLGPVRFFYH